MIIDFIENRARRMKDFYLISYPRSGNTWTVNSLRDYLGAQRAEVMPSVYNGDVVKLTKNISFKVAGSFNKKMPAGIKSHMYYSDFCKREFPKKKVVYILRDGRDVMISFYFYTYGFLGKDKDKAANFSESDFSDFLRENLKHYQNHVIGWGKYKNKIVVKYEDLQRDYIGELHRIQKFLKLKKVLSEKKVKEKYVERFEGMDKNKNALEGDNFSFYRKGIVGDWKNYFTEEHKKLYKEIAGELLVTLGYEKNHDW